ncbi:MAG: hypothetical protein CMD18_02385 [Flavobacteriales bacterium]|nr:hypothetical protein [Flavobacteriales bacterium]|tara:strand:- start:3516 stop:4439 length:924 start_codon:yes stop_codon:yes gene_type:complete
MKSSNIILKVFSLLAINSMLLASCSNGETTEDTETKTEDTTSTQIQKKNPLNVVPMNGAMFSIPSPIQLGGIIQKSGAAYDADILNNPKAYEGYVDLVSQSLNLGVYGADLGYCALYDKQQESIGYIKSAQKLSDILGISDAFGIETIQSVERNLDDKDSLLYIISNSYRRADDYLQTSELKHIGALIIVGGWIESLYFAGILGKENKSLEVVNMIGMQKHTINTMLDKMLTRYFNEPGVEEVYNDLDEVRKSFNKVNVNYEYIAPETNKDKRTTTFKSKATVDMSDEVFNDIVDKIKTIRTKIIAI